MPREKIIRSPEYREVIYDHERWEILRKLRLKAAEILGSLSAGGIEAFAHGSIARGDVWKGSDIDIIVPVVIPTYRVEIILEERGYHIYERFIAIATPNSTPKAYIVLDPMEKITVSLPLTPFSTREAEFYRFGGMVSLEDLERGRRVPGVNKKLVLIMPTKRGHVEAPVIGREAEVASILGIGVETVLERVRVLSRRDEIGRTGVYVKRVLSPNETFEEVLAEIARRDPAVRRKLYGSGLY